MSDTTTTPPLPMTRDEVGTLVGQTLGYVAVTTGVFALGAYLGREVSYGWGWVLFALSLVALFGMRAAAKRSVELAVALMLGFGLLVGLSLAPTLGYYADTNAGSLWQAGAAAALFVAALGAAGYGTRRDLSGLARSFTWALFALIAFGIVLVFVQIPGGSVIYSLVGLVIFAGLTAYDFQRLRLNRDIRSAPLLAVSIFLDLLNVFLLLLTFGGTGD
jgi:FtsH-binding integral membrane protein